MRAATARCGLAQRGSSTPRLVCAAAAATPTQRTSRHRLHQHAQPVLVRGAAPAAAAAWPSHLGRQQQQHRQQQRPQRRGAAWICAALPQASPASPEPIPDDVKLEVNPEPGVKDVLYDESTKTVRIPLASLNDGQRRTKMVMFTCNKCGGRSARLVNPVAWERGAVFCQCQHCQAWHMLRADKSIIEEIRYNDPDWELPAARAGGASDQQQAADAAAALAASGGVAEVAPPDAGGSSSTSSSQQSAGTGLALGPSSSAAGSDEADSGASSTQ